MTASAFSSTLLLVHNFFSEHTLVTSYNRVKGFWRSGTWIIALCHIYDVHIHSLLQAGRANHNIFIRTFCLHGNCIPTCPGRGLSDCRHARTRKPRAKSNRQARVSNLAQSPSQHSALGHLELLENKCRTKNIDGPVDQEEKRGKKGNRKI